MSDLIRAYSNKFNRGEIDDLATARDDVTKVKNSASLMENWLPMRLGPMVYRPGTTYLDEIADPTNTYLVPFVASTTDAAILEFTDNLMRVWVDDELVSTTAPATAIANGTFDSNVTSWTDADESGATSEWQTGGYLRLLGTGDASAIRWQTTTGYTAGEHRLKIVIRDAPVLVELGTGGAVHSNDIFTGMLGPGTHSLVFTPSGNFDVTLSNSTSYQATVDSVEIESAGVFSLPTNIPAASLPSIRYAQSADVMFIGWDSGPQYKVERRGIKSWSFVEYQVTDGPFGLINSSDVTLTPSAIEGGNTVTLTASRPYFKSTDVGTLFRLVSSGQLVAASLTAEDTGTNSIRVTGVESSRLFTILITGTMAGNTVTLQRSTDDTSWTDVQTYGSTTSVTYDDGLDNSILFYRLRIKTGDYTSGTVGVQLDYPGGSIEGICRVAAYTSTTVVNINVLQDFGGMDATREWYRGEWGATTGYPTASALYEGRLWWAGEAKAWGSVSDVFDSYDTRIEGDSAAISKTIGFGPVDDVEWLLPLNRLLMGLASDEVSIRSNSFGDVLTPSNANIKPGTSQGAAGVAPISINSRGYYVQRSLEKIYELDYTVDQDIHDGTDLCVLNPSICEAGIKRIAFTMQPEVRIYVVLNNGECRVYLMDKSEDVSAWSRITTDGTITDVVVLPGVSEDKVYFSVIRNGSHYLEKMAMFSEAKGGSLSKHLDSSVVYTSPGRNITGLDHLEGETVYVWADGQDRGAHTVASGGITVSSNWTNVVVGLRYTATYTTSPLGESADGTVLTFDKRVVNVGFIMRDYWPGSIQVGPDTTRLSDLPAIEKGTAAATTQTQLTYNEKPFPFDGESETDPRITVQGTGPTTILAMTYNLDESNDTREAELAKYYASRSGQNQAT